MASFKKTLSINLKNRWWLKSFVAVMRFGVRLGVVRPEHSPRIVNFIASRGIKIEVK